MSSHEIFQLVMAEEAEKRGNVTSGHQFLVDSQPVTCHEGGIERIHIVRKRMMHILLDRITFVKKCYILFVMANVVTGRSHANHSGRSLIALAQG